MFGFAHLVVLAERELRDKPLKSYENGRPYAQAWLWRHRTLLLVAGVLALFAISGMSA